MTKLSDESPLRRFGHYRRPFHLVNISGGKDSACCYLLAMERGLKFRAVFANTGHEHPLTLEWVRSLSERTGGPKVEEVRAFFNKQFRAKREFVKKNWPSPMAERALSVLEPTGSAFLDLCLVRGRFPSLTPRFCTGDLKIEPINKQVLNPMRRSGSVVRWQGERREESLSRKKLPAFLKIRDAGNSMHPVVIYRPLLDWSAGQVFDLHRKHGLDPNPLYKMGMRRVGCFPCIFAVKSELRAINIRFPEAFDKIMEWERLVGMANKRGYQSFWSPNRIPSKMMAGDLPTVREVQDWSMTGYGGKEVDQSELMDQNSGCSSEYGLCE